MYKVLGKQVIPKPKSHCMIEYSPSIGWIGNAASIHKNQKCYVVKPYWVWNTLTISPGAKINNIFSSFFYRDRESAANPS
jgi:hypothetical protein